MSVRKISGTDRKKPEEIRDNLMERLELENVQAVPRLEKIVVNMGIGDASDNIKKIDEARDLLARVTGQQPVLTRARKSVANFGVRAGDPMGFKVTLRKQKMREFFRKLIHIVLPRTRDFRGLSSGSFDGRGNYTLGLKEQGVFPEITYEEIHHTLGMDITIVISSDEDEQAKALLEEYGFPFKT